MKISVNAGHTPSGTAGCGAVGNLDESKCTREIAPLVAEYLRKEGQEVQLNIENYSNSYNCEDCYNRANKANNWGANLYVEIHLNAGGGRGTEVEVSGFGGQAEQYAKRVSEKVSSSLGLPNRGVKQMNLIVLNRTSMPAILVECCFVDSNDYKHYNADKIARAIAEAILGKSISNNTSIVNKQNNSNKEMYVDMKRYCNGSTRETIYADTKLTKEIGSLDPYEKCDCLGIIEGRPAVLYNVSGGKKIGFAKWTGGVK